MDTIDSQDMEDDMSHMTSGVGGIGGGGGGGTDPVDAKMDLPGALKVLLNSGGRKVSAKAKHVSKDAYLGFLLLRHLRIRDLRAKVSSCLYKARYRVNTIKSTNKEIFIISAFC